MMQMMMLMVLVMIGTREKDTLNKPTSIFGSDLCIHFQEESLQDFGFFCAEKKLTF